MTQKKIIIIGAGIAGLAAGCYAQMNGYDSEIYEMHFLPGGLCTSWERKEYVIDGCLHYLFGSGPGQPFNQVWQELGAVKNRPMIDHAQFMRVIGPSGEVFNLYADPDRLADHMLSLAPESRKHITGFAAGVKDFTTFDMSLLQKKPRSLMDAGDWREFGTGVMPFAMPLARWGRLSAREFAERFDDPFLRRAIPPMFGWPDIPLMAGMSVMAYMHTGNAGFPAGGSLAFARAIEQRYLQLGGTIHYQHQVEKILVKDDRAVGLRLYNDEVREADYVISAADGRGTLYDLLDGQYLSRELERRYGGDLPMHIQLQVSLGIDRDLSGEPPWTTYLLPEPLLIAGRNYDEIGVKIFSFDPSLAPAGKSVVVVCLETEYRYWQRIYGRRLYDTEQSQVADIIIDFLETIYPGIRQQVELKDVATPLSYERYTGNWSGSTCGFLLTNKTMMMMVQGVEKTLPGLENFFMCGQWVEPGGSVPVVAMSGRNAIRLICAQDKQEFETETP
jgi:phytoene dehydrogenase-like protein